MSAEIHIYIYKRNIRSWDLNSSDTTYMRDAVPRVDETVNFNGNSYKVIDIIHKLDDAEVWLLVK